MARVSRPFGGSRAEEVAVEDGAVAAAEEVSADLEEVVLEEVELVETGRKMKFHDQSASMV